MRTTGKAASGASGPVMRLLAPTLPCASLPALSKLSTGGVRRQGRGTA
jgi:hypothetical protein